MDTKKPVSPGNPLLNVIKEMAVRLSSTEFANRFRIPIEPCAVTLIDFDLVNSDFFSSHNNAHRSKEESPVPLAERSIAWLLKWIPLQTGMEFIGLMTAARQKVPHMSDIMHLLMYMFVFMVYYGRATMFPDYDISGVAAFALSNIYALVEKGRAFARLDQLVDVDGMFLNSAMKVLLSRTMTGDNVNRSVDMLSSAKLCNAVAPLAALRTIGRLNADVNQMSLITSKHKSHVSQNLALYWSTLNSICKTKNKTFSNQDNVSLLLRLKGPLNVTINPVKRGSVMSICSQEGLQIALNAIVENNNIQPDFLFSNNPLLLDQKKHHSSLSEKQKHDQMTKEDRLLNFIIMSISLVLACMFVAAKNPLYENNNKRVLDVMDPPSFFSSNDKKQLRNKDPSVFYNMPSFNDWMEMQKVEMSIDSTTTIRIGVENGSQIRLKVDAQNDARALQLSLGDLLKVYIHSINLETKFGYLNVSVHMGVESTIVQKLDNLLYKGGRLSEFIYDNNKSLVINLYHLLYAFTPVILFFKKPIDAFINYLETSVMWTVLVKILKFIMDSVLSGPTMTMVNAVVTMTTTFVPETFTNFFRKFLDNIMVKKEDSGYMVNVMLPEGRPLPEIALIQSLCQGRKLQMSALLGVIEHFFGESNKLLDALLHIAGIKINGKMSIVSFFQGQSVSQSVPEIQLGLARTKDKNFNQVEVDLPVLSVNPATGKLAWTSLEDLAWSELKELLAKLLRDTVRRATFLPNEQNFQPPLPWPWEDLEDKSLHVQFRKLITPKSEAKKRDTQMSARVSYWSNLMLTGDVSISDEGEMNILKALPFEDGTRRLVSRINSVLCLAKHGGVKKIGERFEKYITYVVNKVFKDEKFFSSFLNADAETCTIVEIVETKKKKNTL